MTYLYYIVLIVFFAYAYLIISFYRGWLKLEKRRTLIKTATIPVSLVIAFRNEECNLRNLFSCLANQDYPDELYEIIAVNDHSTDNSVMIVKEYMKKFSNCRLLNLDDKEGKKNAILSGVKNSKHDFILVTDADCLPVGTWISSMVQQYFQDKSGVIAGPVIFNNENRFFEKFQALEFMSLIASGAGAIGIDRPIMANGANLAFDKNIYLQNVNQSYFKSKSGDDIFFIHAVKKNEDQKVTFNASKEAIVYTAPEKNLKSFFSQRGRWASKSIYYKDIDAIFVSIVVLAINLLLCFLLVAGFIEVKIRYLFLIAFLFKSFIDFPLLNSFSAYFGQKKLMKYFIPVQLLYPFYIIITNIIGFSCAIQWKNRRI